MPRNLACAMTPDGILAMQKTVTRRAGWRWLKPDTELQPVHKTRGLRPGESPRKLGPTVVVKAVRLEPLEAITQADVERECVPGVTTPAEFIDMYRANVRPTVDGLVTRIEFEYSPVLEGIENGVLRRERLPMIRALYRRLEAERPDEATRRVFVPDFDPPFWWGNPERNVVSPMPWPAEFGDQVSEGEAALAGFEVISADAVAARAASGFQAEGA